MTKTSHTISHNDLRDELPESPDVKPPMDVKPPIQVKPPNGDVDPLTKVVLALCQAMQMQGWSMEMVGIEQKDLDVLVGKKTKK